MVDPIKLTNYNRTNIELEELILFSICVAGKNAITTSKRLEQFLLNSHLEKKINQFAPFKCLKKFNLEELCFNLKKAGIGCYNNKGRSIYEIVNSDIDLRNCSIDELEKIYGIGSKTSRMFILHSRKNVNVAVLDVHILKYMRDNGCLNVPKNTPNKKQYKILETEFLRLAEKSGKTTADFDLSIWNEYSGRKRSLTAEQALRLDSA